MLAVDVVVVAVVLFLLLDESEVVGPSSAVVVARILDAVVMKGIGLVVELDAVVVKVEFFVTAVAVVAAVGAGVVRLLVVHIDFSSRLFLCFGSRYCVVVVV